MSTTPSFDEIPVLTEVVAETAPETPAPAPAADPVPALVAEPPQPTAALDDDAWNTLEQRLVTRVLDRLQDRIQLVMEDQLRIGIAPVLDHVVARLAVELHAGLQQTVEQVVARAVAQELEHLKRRS
jgi:hypothetical protein